MFNLNDEYVKIIYNKCISVEFIRKDLSVWKRLRTR